jgi:hypothetical protein
VRRANVSVKSVRNNCLDENKKIRTQSESVKIINNGQKSPSENEEQLLSEK